MTVNDQKKIHPLKADQKKDQEVTPYSNEANSYTPKLIYGFEDDRRYPINRAMK